MKLIEKEPYITGKKFSNSSRPAPYRATEEAFRRWSEIILTDATASRFLTKTESAKQFFTAEKDAAEHIPPSEREEAFYALKNGFVSPVVPAKCIFYVTKVYKLYGLCNLVFHLIPDKELHVMFGKNYLSGGYTLRDAVCTLCDERYAPLSESVKKVRFGEYYEVYLPTPDMVAAIPLKIMETIPDSNLREICADGFGLKIGGEYLGFTAGFHGACNSVYDLRKLV